MFACKAFSYLLFFSFFTFSLLLSSQQRQIREMNYKIITSDKEEVFYYVKECENNFRFKSSPQEEMTASFFLKSNSKRSPFRKRISKKLENGGWETLIFVPEKLGDKSHSIKLTQNRSIIKKIDSIKKSNLLIKDLKISADRFLSASCFELSFRAQDTSSSQRLASNKYVFYLKISLPEFKKNNLFGSVAYPFTSKEDVYATKSIKTVSFQLNFGADQFFGQKIDYPNFDDNLLFFLSNSLQVELINEIKNNQPVSFSCQLLNKYGQAISFLLVSLSFLLSAITTYLFYPEKKVKKKRMKREKKRLLVKKLKRDSR